MKGFSSGNLLFMRGFAEVCPDAEVALDPGFVGRRRTNPSRDPVAC